MFGVITACYKGDYFLAKATCASVRFFMPDVPICVIVDGDLDIQELKDVYNVYELRIDSLEHIELRKLLAGSGKSKLAALWEGPFEEFIFLDSDAIVWGDLRSVINLKDYDWNVFAEWPRDEYYTTGNWDNNYGWVSHLFYDPERLRKYDLEFEWRWRHYACTGCFAARKNAVKLEDYLHLEVYAKQNPGLFFVGEQGMLMYLIFKSSDLNILKLQCYDLQIIPAALNHDIVHKRLGLTNTDFLLPKLVENPVVIHFCEQKPYIHNIKAFSYPFTIFRLAHYKNLFKDKNKKSKAWMKVISEEIVLVVRKIIKKLMNRSEKYQSGT